MFKLIVVLLFTFLMNGIIFAQTEVSGANYRIYDSQGNSADLDRIIDAARNYDVVFLGENHDDAVAHSLQAQIFKQVFEKYGKDRKIALSMEMFERDLQTVVNEYLQDLITENHFLLSSRPWGNYKTDYRPLLEFAKANKLEVIAANAPRRYVNMVSRNGRDALNALSPEAKRWLAPLPYGEASDAYAKKFTAQMGGSPEANMGMNKILSSQSLWDATMAFSISEYLKRTKNPLVVQLNGSFHSENHLGTAEQLLKYAPKTKILVVTMRYEENFTSFDKTKHAGLGDFVILTDAKVPRSFKQ